MRKTTEWHWVLSVAGNVPSGFGRMHYYGTYTPSRGTTRHAAFEDLTKDIFARWRESTGSSQDPVVTFWSLEPNNLT